MIRAILDTNLWISYLISKRLGKIDKLFDRRSLVLLFSEESVEEFIEVARRPRFRTYFQDKQIDELLSLFDAFGEIVDVTSKIEICRDPKDNFLLALARDGKADFLVTGDAELLVINRFEKTTILTYSEFEKYID